MKNYNLPTAPEDEYEEDEIEEDECEESNEGILTTMFPDWNEPDFNDEDDGVGQFLG